MKFELMRSAEEEERDASYRPADGSGKGSWREEVIKLEVWRKQESGDGHRSDVHIGRWKRAPKQNVYVQTTIASLRVHLILPAGPSMTSSLFRFPRSWQSHNRTSLQYPARTNPSLASLSNQLPCLRK